MDNLERYMKEQKQKLVDEVEAELISITLVNELVRLFPMSHGAIDKTHMIWARCLRDLVWLGWLSEAKKRRGAYSAAICDSLEQSLGKAFDIGKQYATERP